MIPKMIRNPITRNLKLHRSSAGFTLIEAAISLLVLAIGVIGLAAMMTDGIAYMNMSQADYIAQQKAEEAVESIFYARDTGLYGWAQITNVSKGGMFLDGPEVLCDPGADGIIDTADDNLNNLDAIYLPGAGGNLYPGGVKETLNNYTRTIAFTDVIEPSSPGNVVLRQITVTINYTAGKFQRQYVLTSYICKYQ